MWRSHPLWAGTAGMLMVPLSQRMRFAATRNTWLLTCFPLAGNTLSAIFNGMSQALSTRRIGPLCPWKLTNPDVLRLLHHSDGAHELSRGASSILWASRDEDGSLYLAFFNTGTHEAHLECALSSLGLSSQSSVQVRDLWEREDIGTMTGSVHFCVPCHGCRLFRLHLL